MKACQEINPQDICHLVQSNSDLKPQPPCIYLVEDFVEFDQLAQSWLKKNWSNKNCLAIDTEFERRTTFFAKLALIQIYDGEAIYLVDPLKMSCPDSFRKVMGDPSIIKIMHSSKEDLEVMYTAWNCKTNNLFDTQVAYNFLHAELSIGYAKIVEELTQHIVDKQQTNSDWLKRPLSEQQLIYAAKDVLYLLDIYERLNCDIENKNYYNYFVAECHEYCLTAPLKIDTPADYRDAKDAWLLNEIDLGLFKRLFEWREGKAKTDDRTKNHIIRDPELVYMAQTKPGTSNQLKNIGDLHPRSIRLYADDWFDIISQWQQSDQIQLTKIISPREVENLKRLSNELESVVKSIAKDNQISSTLLFSKRLIRKCAYAMLTNGQLPIQWQGWRKALLENAFNEKSQAFRG